MVRLIGFFLLVVGGLFFLRSLPWIGGLFHGLLGFWATAILLSLLITRLSGAMLRSRRLASRTRELGNVDTPHNQGKLGMLLLSHGRPARALPHLAKAVEGEPDFVDWHYRLGCALLAARKPEEARESLLRASALNPEHAYGAVQLRLAEALLAGGDEQAALETLERFEGNHGANPESACRKGRVLRALGRKEEARVSFARVGSLYGKLPRFQRRGQWTWLFRSWLGRLV